ncbi:unnamed protein product [Ixodes persulcatus]
MQSAGSHCLEYKNATYCASLLSRTPFFPKQTASCEPHARRTDRTSKLCHAITILLVPTCRLQLPQHCPGSHRTHCRLGGEWSIERRPRNLRSLGASRPVTFMSMKLVASTSGEMPAHCLTHQAQ